MSVKISVLWADYVRKCLPDMSEAAESRRANIFGATAERVSACGIRCVSDLCPVENPVIFLSRRYYED